MERKSPSFPGYITPEGAIPLNASTEAQPLARVEAPEEERQYLAYVSRVFQQENAREAFPPVSDEAALLGEGHV